MKKEWIKPEVSTLGMENTNEDAISNPSEYLWCKYCRQWFPLSIGQAAHERKCEDNPANNPAVGGGEFPTPELS